MKKSLVALAVLAASGASFAQSTVTVYGIVDLALVSHSGTAPSTTEMKSGGLSSSRYGFKGSEDLGGGLKANFKLEQGFKADTGAAGSTTATAFSRAASIGLSGGFGEVQLGKLSTAYNEAEGAADPAFGSAFSPMSAVFASNNNYNDRIANTIYYATPSFGGITGAISYSLGENKDTPVVGVGAGNTTSMNVMYDGGPLFVGFGYQTQKPTAASISENYTQLNATYDLGVAKLLGAYGRVTNSGGTQDNNVREWLIGADFPVSSALTISGGYARSTLSVPGVADETSKAFSLAATYSLSKRTTVYGGLESHTVSQAGSADTDHRMVGMGVKHTF